MILNSPVSTAFIVVNLKGELYKCSFIFRFWTYSQRHKFSNILYSFLGKEGIAKALDIATASRLAGKNYLVLPAKEMRWLTFDYSKLETKLVLDGSCFNFLKAGEVVPTDWYLFLLFLLTALWGQAQALDLINGFPSVVLPASVLLALLAAHKPFSLGMRRLFEHTEKGVSANVGKLDTVR